MVWNCSIVAVTLLFGVSGKSKAFRNESKTIGENDRAEYGKGFDKSNLRKMRQFYCTFPIRDTLCPELSWSHYRVLIRINDEQALIDHLQHFLLELGRGFSFVARQKRFTLDGQDFFIDLVFYNYILKCFVLIDLKMGKLTHQDLERV